MAIGLNLQAVHSRSLRIKIIQYKYYNNMIQMSEQARDENSLMNIGSTVGPNPELPLCMQARQSLAGQPNGRPPTLCHGAYRAAQERLDHATSQPEQIQIRVIAPFTIHTGGAVVWPSLLAAYGLYSLDHPPELPDLIHVRGQSSPRPTTSSAHLSGHDVCSAFSGGPQN